MVTSKIIESQIVAKIDNRLNILSFENGTDGFCTIRVECLKYIQLYDYIFIDGEKTTYELILGAIRVAGSVDYSTEIKLPIPLFFYGTLSNTKFEWTEFSNKEADKLPFIWLNSPEADRTDNFGDGGQTESQCELWFVHFSDWGKTNQSRINESIEPLSKLVKSFVDKIDHRFPPYDNYTTRIFPKFVDENSNKLIFPSELCAIQLDINIKFFPYYCRNF
jgi:hypothetical protein